MFSTLTGNKQSVSDTELLELSFVPEMEALYLQPCFTPIKAVTSLLPLYPIYANYFEASNCWGRMEVEIKYGMKYSCKMNATVNMLGSQTGTQKEVF